MKGTTIRPANCICRDSDCHGDRRDCGKALPVPRGANQVLCEECRDNRVRKANTKGMAKWRRKNPDKVRAAERRFYAAHAPEIREKKKQERAGDPEKAKAKDFERYHADEARSRAKGRRMYRKHRAKRLARNKDNYQRQKRKLEEVDALRLQIEAGKVAAEKLKRIEMGDLVVRRKGGRPAEDKKGAKIDELATIYERANQRVNWPEIQKQIAKEFRENNVVKALQTLRRRYLARLAVEQ
jgi:hypothetical protein